MPGEDVVAAVCMRAFCPTSSLGSHKAHHRKTPALFGIIIAWLFLQIIAALVRYKERRRGIAESCSLCIGTAKFLKPFLRKLHARILPVAAKLSGFARDNSMADGGILLGRMLQQTDLSGNLL